MSTDELPTTEGGQLSAAYGKYNAQVLSRGLCIGNLLSVVGVPGGFVLDYFLYPQRFVEFLGIRMIVAALLLIFTGVLRFKGFHHSLRKIKALGILSALTINFAFCAMIYLTDGPKSPYYAGLNLIITCWSVLMPWTAVQTGIMCVISLAGYVLACVANSNFAQASSYPLFAYNCFFILITIAVCVSITYFLSRARFDDFGLRHQLAAQNRTLQDLDRIKTQFFSNVSHELRTPLTLILGPVETLLSKGESLDAKLHEDLLLIHRNSLRLLKLINDLLDLTRLDQGAEKLRKKSVRLGIFVKGIVESVRHLGLSKQLRFKIEECDPEAVAVIDPIRMEKVLTNLLTNAIKYTPSRGSITVRWKGTPAETQIEVEDTGVGIPTEDLPRIFDRFHQVRSNATNQNQGVGIGLALAKELVVEHQGELEVESEVGRGTLFRIRVPAGEPESAMENVIVDSEPRPDEPFAKAFRAADLSMASYGDGVAENYPLRGGGDEVILVADDENDMRRYIVGLLAEDHRVVQTASGLNVVDLIGEHDPALVLLDWMMPGKDGLTVCRDIRADPRHRDIKIVLLTARIDEKSKIEALQSGADDFLTKPFSSVEVKTRVANLLRAGRLQKDLRLRNGELTDAVRKLQQTETMLIQSEKMNAIGSLSAGLLHEINNPLNYTLAAIGIANQAKESLSPDMREIVADIEEGMIRIRDVITHLKNFAYPEKPGAESIFSLDEVFQSAKKIVSKEIENIRLEVDLPETLVIRGQKTQIMHLFINLLSNSARALTGVVDKRPVISVRGFFADAAAVVEFSDNGPGIPEEIMNRIFEPFFTTREVGSGMGMGLSICHTILEAHHGTIAVDNSPAGGAVFTINLPLAHEAPLPC